MKIPVLFIIFNRLDTTQKVFKSIREYKPEKFFIAADGPRSDIEGEKEKCEHVRKWVLDNIDWNCDLETLFHDENIGCGLGPSTAITWFFEHVDEGIILEDDCVPHPDLFNFYEQLLPYYRNDNRISILSGCNFDVDKKAGTSDSYFYSVFPYTWAWATWKRSWKGFDYNLVSWRSENQKKMLTHVFKEKKYYLAWKKIFDGLSNDIPKQIWDYQFFYQCFKRKQLSVVPAVNLVTNIGTGEMATHTRAENNPKMNLKTEPMEFPLKHPVNFNRNYKYDIFLQELNYGVVEQISLIRKTKRIIKKQLKRLANL